MASRENDSPGGRSGGTAGACEGVVVGSGRETIIDRVVVRRGTGQYLNFTMSSTARKAEHHRESVSINIVIIMDVFNNMKENVSKNDECSTMIC